MKPVYRAVTRLARAAAILLGRDWHATPVERAQGAPKRARGSLSQTQLGAAERWALKYGLALPSPTNSSARESALIMVWQQMQNTRSFAPSVAGERPGRCEESNEAAKPLIEEEPSNETHRLSR
jgi:hypothetical protein